MPNSHEHRPPETTIDPIVGPVVPANPRTLAKHRPLHRRIGLLYAIAFLFEVAAMMLMTWMRYRFQGLEVDYVAFDETSNLYGLILAIPFIGMDIAGLMIPALHRPTRVIPALVIPAIGLLILWVLITSEPGRQPYIGVVYLGFRAIALGVMVVLFGQRRRPRWRKGLTAVIFSSLFALGAYLLVVISILFDPLTEAPIESRTRGAYDAAVILGAAVWSGDKPSPVFRERIEKGYELLSADIVEFLVLTGGNAPNELTEAEVAKRSLLSMGAEPTRIVLEERTSSTVEQVLFVRDELKKQGWKSFLIVSDQFHLKRALEICDFNDVDAQGIASESPLGPTTLVAYHLRESAALILYWMFGL